MKEHIGARGGYGLVKRGPGHVGLHVQAKLEGHWTLTMQDRESGKIVGRRKTKNTILTAGKQRLLELVTGASAAHFGNSVDLDLYISDGGALQKAFAAPDAAPSHAVNREVSWTFSDISADTYDPNWAEFGDGTLIFSEADVSGWGSKPASQNWIYTYTLIIDTSDNNLDYAGLDEMLHLFTGDSLAHWDQSGMNLKVFDNWSAGDPTGVLGTYSGNQETNYPDETNNQLTMRWVIPAGTLTGTWEVVQIFEFSGTTILRSGGNPPVLDNLGSKGSTEEWQYTYTLSI